MDEFDLIQRYFQPLSQQQTGVEAALSIGDDGAVVDIPAGQQLVITTDTLVGGVHFPAQAAPFDIGVKALAVNLSDLAAMGATPAWYTLSVTLPQYDSVWLRDFCAGLAWLADVRPVRLIGGDTTKGPLSINIQAMGLVKQGCALQRSGAQIGDDIYLSGCIGEAGVGLKLALGQINTPLDDGEYYLNRLHRPEPRVALGQALTGVAHACIDVSDGLFADVQHILQASGCGAVLNVDAIPIAQVLRDTEDCVRYGFDSTTLARQFANNAGDDYELCFTVAPQHADRIRAIAARYEVPITRIGRVTEQQGMRDDHGQPLLVQGYRHFV